MFDEYEDWFEAAQHYCPWLLSSLFPLKDILANTRYPWNSKGVFLASAEQPWRAEVVPLLWATGVAQFRACFLFICVGLLLCGTTGLTVVLVKLGAYVVLAVLCAYAMRTQRDLVARLETFTDLKQCFEERKHIKASFFGVQCCFSKMSWCYMCSIPAAIELPQALLAAGSVIGKRTHSADVEVMVAGALLVITCAGAVVSAEAFYKFLRGDTENWDDDPFDAGSFWQQMTHAADAADAPVISAISLDIFAAYEQREQSLLTAKGGPDKLLQVGRSDRGVQFRTKVVYGTCLRLPLKLALLGFQWATYVQFGTLNESLTSLSLHSSIAAAFFSIATRLPDQMSNIRFWQQQSDDHCQGPRMVRVLLINLSLAVLVLLACTLGLTAIVSCNVMSWCVMS